MAQSKSRSRQAHGSRNSRQQGGRHEVPVLRTLEPITPAFLVPKFRRRARYAAAIPSFVFIVGIALIAGHTLIPVGGVAIGLLFLVIGIAWNLLNLRLGSPIRLAHVLDSVDLQDASFKQLMNILEGLCVVNGIALPQVRIVNDKAANAIVLGWNERSSTLVLTTGLLDVCDRIELEGVIAHEIASIKRGDMRNAAFATVACGALSLFTSFAAKLVDSLLRPERMTEADMGGVSITRYPPGLLYALRTIDEVGLVRPTQLTRSATRLTAASWLINLEEAMPRRSIAGHLTIDERIGLLAEL